MRNKAKTSLIFVVGLLVGAFVTFIIFGKMNQRLYARSYALSVMEQAFLATELRAHRQDELQKRIEANLPSAVLAILLLCNRSPTYQELVWGVVQQSASSGLADTRLL